MGLCGGYISNWWTNMNQLSCWQVGWGTATLADLSWGSEVIAEPVLKQGENGSVVGRIHNWPPHAKTTRTISNNFEVEIHHTCHLILEVIGVQPLSNLERHAQTWPITAPILVKLGDLIQTQALRMRQRFQMAQGQNPQKSTDTKELPGTLIPIPGHLEQIFYFLEGCIHTKHIHQALVPIHRSVAQLHLLRLTALRNTTTSKKKRLQYDSWQ